MFANGNQPSTFNRLYWERKSCVALEYFKTNIIEESILMIVGTTKVFSCLFNAIDAVLHNLLKQNEEQNVEVEEKYRCCYIIGAILLCLSPAQLFKRCTEVAHKMRLWGLVGEGYSF